MNPCDPPDELKRLLREYYAPGRPVTAHEAIDDLSAKLSASQSTIRQLDTENTRLRERLERAEQLLREEATSWTCVEAGHDSDDKTASFCIDLTHPNGGPTCWYCRARRAFLAEPRTGEPGK